MLSDIIEYMKGSLSKEVLQEISDKMSAISLSMSADGAGLTSGQLMEKTILEIFKKNMKEFEACHYGQMDMMIKNIGLSFKKISGKSILALSWSKNTKDSPSTFECPIIIMNVKGGVWWKKKTGEMDNTKMIPAGFFLIDDAYCRSHISLTHNNKSNTIIDQRSVYNMLCHAMSESLYMDLPPPRIERFTFSINNAFVETLPKKWPEFSKTGDKLRFIDLFCGVGGFHQAMTDLGHQCVFACDIDEECRVNYQKNYGIEPAGDIRNIPASLIPPFDIVCAGFPCQPFSKAGDQLGFNDKEKGNLFLEICRIIEYHKPQFLILENVANITSHDKGRTWQTIHDMLIKIGYTIPKKPIIASPVFFGTPQMRNRAFIVGIKDSILPEIPKWKTVKTDIRSVLAHDGLHPQLNMKMMETGRIWDEFCAILTDNAILIPHFPIWTDWWDNDLCEEDPFYKKYENWIKKNRIFYNNHRLLLENWLIEARKNPYWVGAVRKLEWQVNGDERSLKECMWTMRGSGVRVRKTDCCPTLVAMAMIPVYGPEWRLLSPREVCRLQDFPDTYIHSDNPRSCYRQMGNAVNVRVVKEVAQWLLKK